MSDLFKPHYIRDTRRVLRKMLRTYGNDEAMKLAVGGAYEEMGVKERDCLILVGLNALDYLIDVGCGSGRLAFALRDVVSLRYLGTEVVPEFVKYSIEKCGRSDWQFVLVDNLNVPEQDNQADMIAFFSLFPHLSRRECFIYLKEAARVVLPGGRIVVSFLDSSLVDHRLAAGHWFNQIMHRLLGNRVKLTLLNQIEMQAWGDHLNLELNFIGTEAIGQNVCVYRKNEII